MSSLPTVKVHILTYHSGSLVNCCLEALYAQEEYRVGERLILELSDNSPADSSIARLAAEAFPGLTTFQNPSNLGFCGGHNLAVQRWLKGREDFLLILNPDVALAPGALSAMVAVATSGDRVGMVTPLLLRADEQLRALQPEIIDAAGMEITPSLRHFDRGSGQPLVDERSQTLLKEGNVFGATGACILISRACARDLLLPRFKEEEALWQIYPQLRENCDSRAQLFDEAFFAYREDADLSWRAQLRGWDIRFCPEACGYHQRQVTPERRARLPAELNKLGVRNRFLLQLSNMTKELVPRTFLQGLLFRNIVVVLGALSIERTSLSGLREAWRLRHRCMAKREFILRGVTQEQRRQVVAWFRKL
jgi:GT2 family glycosyltransferase